MDFSELFAYGHNHDASDIHISSGHPPSFRIHGDIRSLKVPPLETEQVKSLLRSIMNDKQHAEYEEFLEIDFAVHFGIKRYRVNAFNTMNGPAAVLRSIATEVKTLEDINAPETFTTFAGLQKGIILVTGPTGSGKSTTLSAIINYINKNFYKHILTIEDPVEFIHKSDKSLINQREIGAHSLSFNKSLKSALREDPDIILVGELRDIETIKLALTAAETGHLVISTLHTSSAAQTINRIIDVFAPEEKEMIRTMLSNSIEVIISQKLIKRANDRGRVSAFEVLIAIPAIRNLIKEGKVMQINSLMQINSKIGMKVMKDSIEELVRTNVIKLEDAKLALNSKEIDDQHSLNNMSARF